MTIIAGVKRSDARSNAAEGGCARHAALFVRRNGLWVELSDEDGKTYELTPEDAERLAFELGVAAGGKR